MSLSASSTKVGLVATQPDEVGAASGAQKPAPRPPHSTAASETPAFDTSESNTASMAPAPLSPPRSSPSTSPASSKRLRTRPSDASSVSSLSSLSSLPASASVSWPGENPPVRSPFPSAVPAQSLNSLSILAEKDNPPSPESLSRRHPAPEKICDALLGGPWFYGIPEWALALAYDPTYAADGHLYPKILPRNFYYEPYKNACAAAGEQPVFNVELLELLRGQSEAWETLNRYDQLERGCIQAFRQSKREIADYAWVEWLGQRRRARWAHGYCLVDLWHAYVAFENENGISAEERIERRLRLFDRQQYSTLSQRNTKERGGELDPNETPGVQNPASKQPSPPPTSSPGFFATLFGRVWTSKGKSEYALTVLSSVQSAPASPPAPMYLLS
ncbi:hypothetical protein JCM8097_008085 [Rhodosporidiobolus ruineniae]